MKKACVLLLILVMLTGCADPSTDMDRAMALRTKLLQAGSVSFGLDISADYGDKLCLFSLDCLADAKGNIQFTVAAPETIEGITGKIGEGDGALTFDDTALHFDLMTDDQLSPVSAPWVLLKTLRSGYLTSAGMDGEQLRLTIDDSFEDDALTLDIWLDESDLPQRAEVVYDGKNILSLLVKNLQIQSPSGESLHRIN